jgi:hypothetical protein
LVAPACSLAAGEAPSGDFAGGVAACAVAPSEASAVAMENMPIGFLFMFGAQDKLATRRLQPKVKLGKSLELTHYRSTLANFG